MYNFVLKCSEETKLRLFERIANFIFFSPRCTVLVVADRPERLLENGLV
jgi:hypothetical protein